MPHSLPEVLQTLLGPTYRIERELTGAGMSRVFVARDVALGRDVVVKVLPPDLVTDRSIGRFRREIELTTRLQHPHILPVITAGSSDHLLWYVTPYIHGRSLKDRLAAGEHLPFAEAIRVALALLDVVGFAHDRGVVHRDIKPGNVLLSEGHPILADFGIATALAADDDPTPGSTSVAASPIYVAPEHPTGPAADLYATATLVHELLTGVLPERPPRVQQTVNALLAAHPDVGRLRARQMADVLTRARQTDPARRYGSAFALSAAIRGAAGAVLTPALRPPQPRWPLAAAVAGAAVLGTIFAAVSMRESVAPVSRGRPGPLAAVVTQPAVVRALHDVRVVTGDVGSVSDETVAPEAPTATSYDSAMTAVAAGRLAEAQRLLREEIRADPANAMAQLQLALVGGMFDTRSSEEARAAAGRAIALGGLPPAELALATGMVALADASYPEACEAFERARRLRPGFYTWMGIAECHARDDRVMVAGGEHRFRSSYARAATAYVEAIRSVSGPAPAAAYQRLGRVLLTEPYTIRRGAGDDGSVFIAFPVAEGDSIAFHPHPPGPAPRGEVLAAHHRGLSRARTQLRALLVTWVRQSPEDATARAMLADVPEADGNIREPGADGTSALDEIRAARRLPATRYGPLSLARSEIRLLIRAREFADAARLADSLLAEHPRPDAREAEYLVGIALMTGKLQAATDMLELLAGTPPRQLRGPDGRLIELPAALVGERAAFVAAAAVGACTAEVREGPARLMELLDGVFPPSARPPGLESAFIERPMTLAYPCLGGDAFRILRTPTRNAQRFISANDPVTLAGMRREFEAADRERASDAMRIEGTEPVLVESWMRLAGGDTAGARRLLTTTLDNLPLVHRSFMHSEVLAATLPRVMALRAELAAAAGDHTAARQWATAVADLWEKADEPLHVARDQMRALAAQAAARGGTAAR